MTEYPKVRLGEICDLKNGRAFKPEDWSNKGVPIIRIQNLNDQRKPFNYWEGPVDRQIAVKPEDVLLAWSGTPGTSFGAHIWNGPYGILNQHIFRVDLDDQKVTKTWWVRAVNSRLNELIARAHGGVGLKHVTRRMVDELEIPLPSLAEQKRIAAILDQADALRRLRKRAIARLDTLGQAIFHEMFGDPRSNPKGWRVGTLGELIRVNDKINYGVVQPGDDYANGVPLIRAADIAKPTIVLSELKRIDPAIDRKYSRSRIKGDEILVACVGSIGAVSLADLHLKGVNIARAVARIPVDSDRADRLFVSGMLTTSMVQGYFENETRTVAQPTLNIKQLIETPIVIPPIEFQLDYAGRVGILETHRKMMGRNVLRVSGLFRSLQHRAFRGEL